MILRALIGLYGLALVVVQATLTCGPHPVGWVIAVFSGCALSSLRRQREAIGELEQSLPIARLL